MDLTKEILLKEKIDHTSHILDVGCGTGQTAAYLATHYGANVTGMDINPIMVEKAKIRMAQLQLPVEIIQGSIEDCFLEDHTFDFIISESVLAFANTPKSLKEILRLLKNGGRFVANELTMNQQLAAPLKEEVKQFYGFDSLLMENDWINLLKNTGFQNIQVHRPQYSLLENHTIPEFHYSENIEPELFMVMMEHFNNMYKYEGIMDYRIISGAKM
ncbi:class I SAM-dependent methyltransferase [Lederbergia panacisoli]|uniref:class I SAM-dependent methyltransferase n=1 Tax=Lederbergia panacisoli TaxID=1255251 RepID=UPI00214B6334|nr:class I SAM-dependent methyltransferase [Lederbergia panacisoli]MCR2822068.1 class I SAM-dependent methyltransferase [Lederbergia panacisoli]